MGGELSLCIPCREQSQTSDHADIGAQGQGGRQWGCRLRESEGRPCGAREADGTMYLLLVHEPTENIKPSAGPMYAYDMFCYMSVCSYCRLRLSADPTL